MQKVNYLMNSWDLEYEAQNLPESKLKNAILKYIELFKVKNPYMSFSGIIYRNNLQYMLENIDKPNLIAEIKAFLPLEN